MSETLTHDEETMQKVWGALLRAGLSAQKAIDVVSDMQNAGILFRERGETEWEYGNATELGFMYGMPSLESAIRNCNSVTTVTLPDGTVERYKRRVVRRRKAGEWEEIESVG